MKKPILYILTGRAFSGKSTLARKISQYKDAILISQDELLFKNKEKVNHLNEKKAWKEIFKIAENEIQQNLLKGKSVVFDNVNTQYKHREYLRAMAQKCGAIGIVVYLNTPEKILKKRQKENRISQVRHHVSQIHIDDLKKRFEPPINEENVFKFNPESDFEIFIKALEIIN